MIEFKIEPLQITKKVLKELALYISRFFELDELESMCERIVSIDFIKRRPIDQDSVVLYKDSIVSKHITVTDHLDLDHFPYKRWIEIEFKNSMTADYQIFYYSYNKKLYHYLTNAFCFGYNIRRYGSFIYLQNYDLYKNVVLDSYSKVLYIFINNINSKEELYQSLLTLVHSFLSDKKLRNPSVYKYFKVLRLEDDVVVECIALTDETLKFQISNNTDRVNIYINRNIIGINNIILAIERSYTIYIKNKG